MIPQPREAPRGARGSRGTRKRRGVDSSVGGGGGAYIRGITQTQKGKGNDTGSAVISRGTSTEQSGNASETPELLLIDILGPLTDEMSKKNQKNVAY